MGRESFLNMYQQSGVVHSICSPLFEKSTINNFSYFEISANGEYFYLNSNADYFNQLLKSQAMNNIAINYLNSHICAGIHLVNSDCNYCANILANQPRKELNEKFQMDHSLIMVFFEKNNSKDTIKIYTYSNERNSLDKNHFYINHMKPLNQFNTYFHSRMERFIQRSTKAIIHPSQIEQIQLAIENINKQKTLGEEFLKIFDLNYKNLNSSIANPKLAPIEKNILQLCFEGKTAKETGYLLNMSQRAIERTFHQLRIKFNCQSKPQLIYKLKELGLLKIEGKIES